MSIVTTLPPNNRSYLIDENLCFKGLVRGLTQAGFDVTDARRAGLGGEDDPIIFRYAQTHHMTIITRDNDFLAYKPPHAGIIFCSFLRQTNKNHMVWRIRGILHQLADQEVANHLWRLEPGMVIRQMY